MVWYAHLFQNFPQFVVIHIVKGFGIVSKAEIHVFLERSCFFDDPAAVGNLNSVSEALYLLLYVLPGEYQGWGSLVGCHLWGRTELDTTEVT